MLRPSSTPTMLCILLGAALQSSAEDRIVQETSRWAGKHADPELRKAAPKQEFIADAESFRKLWNAWRAGEDVPEVDFEKELVLVATAPGPNRVIIIPRLDGEGHLRFVNAGTKVAGPGFGYVLMKLPREGIVSVNGVSLDTGEAVAEYIKVEVKGTLRASVLAIGGETTGTVINAKGLSWELDVGNNLDLQGRVRKLNNQAVIVKGELDVRPGVEVRQRWIVTVESLEAAE